jgi:hypothetical protein
MLRDEACSLLRGIVDALDRTIEGGVELCICHLEGDALHESPRERGDHVLVLNQTCVGISSRVSASRKAYDKEDTVRCK